ncbi:unnamed protein product, partial [Polarella glacialis]
MDRMLLDFFATPVRATEDLCTKSWYTSNLRAVKELVQEPSEAEPDASEDVLEVIVGSALLGPLPQQEQPDVQIQSVAPPCFVRLWMDGEFVGETSVFDRGYTSRPVWNERFLLIPRASRCTRFEVVEATECPTVRCHCALGTESLWRTATCGVPLSMDVPLLHYGEEAVGSLRIHARIWDGLPLQ